MSNQAFFAQNEYGPIENSYGTAPIAPQQQPLLLDSPDRKNFPPCWPWVRHNITTDIDPTLQPFVKKAYFGWFMHIIGLLFNMICISAATFSKVTGIGNFFLGLTGLIVGVPGSFFIYFLLYKAVKQSNSFYFVIWFGLTAFVVLFDFFMALGINSFFTGGAGFLMMISAFSKDKVVVGIMLAVSTFLWIGLILYNGLLFNRARIIYKELGGHKAATRDFTNAAATTAYDNRDAIRQVVVDNKDTIRQVVVDNKDVIVDFAHEHRQEIVQVAKDNKSTALKIAHDNRDTIWENREVVHGVFGASPPSGAQSHV